MKPSTHLLPRLWLAAAALLTAVLPAPAAALIFEATKIDHTATAEETSFTATYNFENKSKETVKIDKVVTSCSCTAADLKKKSYAPGEKGSLDVTFEYEDRQGFQTRTITLDTSEGKQVLTMNVEIPEFVTIDVPVLSWEQGAEPTPQKFTVKVASSAPFKVVSGGFENENAFSGKLEDVTKSGEKARTYTFTVTPKSTGEFAKSAVSFKTDLPKDKPRTYKAFVMVKHAPKN
jgi:hypothetical protein